MADRLEEEGLQARLLLQVHDELIFAAPKEAPAAPKSPAPAPVAKTEFEKPVERVKMSRRRQTIAIPIS